MKRLQSAIMEQTRVYQETKEAKAKGNAGEK
jgi:hypothetical protein